MAVDTDNETMGEDFSIYGEELGEDDVDSLLADARTRGAGRQVLEAFSKSGAKSWKIRLDAGPFAGKDADKAYTSLNNAKKATVERPDGTRDLAVPGSQNIRVIKRKTASGDEYVALVNTALVSKA